MSRAAGTRLPAATLQKPAVARRRKGPTLAVNHRPFGNRVDHGGITVVSMDDIGAPGLKIWIVRKHPEPGAVLEPDLHSFRSLPDDRSGSIYDIEPTMRLEYEAAEALGVALGEVPPPNSATERHLADAIKVRDRLLALIEEGKA